MTPLQPDAHWLAALQARASQPPRAPRLPLLAGAARVGSVEAGFFEKNGLQAAPELREVLQKTEHSGAPAWHLAAPLDASLAALAQALRAAGLAGAWRDELLAVTDEQGTALGVVERAAVRPLGIATRAVHLLARSPDGRHWVQKRALNKANDPGLWDTLMGGMIAAADTLQTALARETWEEAGLRLDAVAGLARGGRVTIRRPADDGGGAGYVLEHIDWFQCTLPDGVVPVNQDGEVDEFRLMTRDELLARLQRDEFTLEAALMLCAAGV